MPLKFGIRSPYRIDADSDIVLKDNPYSYYSYAYSKVNYSSYLYFYIFFLNQKYNITPFISFIEFNIASDIPPL
jgi:hypothetical protein